ncbi:MAG: DUF2905 domain-containing protein [Noviherbaspirillum sp.]
MIRWVVAIFIGLFIFSALFPGLSRIGIGRLPGDIRFRVAGQPLCLPFGSTVLWSALAFLIAEVVALTCAFC